MTSLLMLVLSANLVAPTASSSIKPAATRDTASTTFVIVKNDRSVPLTVFAEGRLGETELGYVAPHATEFLRLRNTYAAQGEVDIVVDPRGESTQHTGFQPIKVGEEMMVRVPERR